MKTLETEIKYKEKELKELKLQLKESFESVKECWGNIYHDSFTDRCEMIYALIQGKIFKPYRLNPQYKIERAKEWKTNLFFDYCNIYQGFGNPIGFISLKNGLFDATSRKHKQMWLSNIEHKKEERSFEEFTGLLKTDLNFLIESFETLVKERETGVYSTDNYLIEYENKRLKTGKYYIYLENTSRRL
jgi:hypothetical protein